MELYLVRHGLTDWNRTHRYQGHTDVPLAAEGLRQAEALAARLRATTFDAAWSSDLSRARVTAETVVHGRGLAVNTDPGLRELSLGCLEGLHRHEAEADHAELLADWARAPSACRFPGGETLHEVQDRLWARLTALAEAHAGQRVLVVSHGYAIITALCRALSVPLDAFRGLWLDPTGLSELRFGPRGVSVRRINDTAHLEGL